MGRGLGEEGFTQELGGGGFSMGFRWEEELQWIFDGFWSLLFRGSLSAPRPTVGAAPEPQGLRPGVRHLS